MAKTRGTGLLMVWTDIDSEFEPEFNRWYDEEHIARLLAVPGFLSAGRYVALRGGPKYLAMYELEDHNVLRSAAYLDCSLPGQSLTQRRREVPFACRLTGRDEETALSRTKKQHFANGVAPAC